MGTLYVDTLEPEGGTTTLTVGETGQNTVIGGNTIKFNTLQDAGGNAIFTSNGSGVLSSVNSSFGSDMNLILSQTVTGGASISFTSGITSTYGEYIFKCYNINPATDATELTFNASTDGGSNYNAVKTTTTFGAYHQVGSVWLTYQSGWDLAESADAQDMIKDQGNGADECGVGELHLFNPASTTFVKQFTSIGQGYHKDDASLQLMMAGYLNTTSAIDAVQFKMASGNFDGTIKMFGLK